MKALTIRILEPDSDSFDKGINLIDFKAVYDWFKEKAA